MLSAGMTINAVAINTGCSTRAIRHLRQRFQATWRTEDRPRSGRPRVTACGQDRYIRYTYLHNRFQTATATSANTHGTHNNRISAKNVRNGLHKGGRSARRPYVGCVLARRQSVNIVNWAHTHQRWLRQQWNSRVQIYRRKNERYSDCCVLERGRVFFFFFFWGGGGGVLSWSGRALHMGFALILSYQREFECQTLPR